MAATRSMEEYLDLPYAIALSRGEGEEPWLAQVDDLPGCEARGRSPEEAAARVQDAMTDWIATALADGKAVPTPRQELSGRLLVRMPRTLHADLARAASREQVSLNQFITAVLSSAVAWRRESEPALRASPLPAPLRREAQAPARGPSVRTLLLV